MSQHGPVHPDAARALHTRAHSSPITAVDDDDGQAATQSGAMLQFPRGNAKLRLGEVLVRSGAITREQLVHALSLQQKKRVPLGELLIKLGYLTEEAMRQALGRQLNVSYIDLDRLTIDKALARTINSNYARRHAIVPIALVGQTLTVCMDDPTNQSMLEELSRTTGLILTVVTASRDAINRAFGKLYEDKPKPAAAAAAGQPEGVDLVVEAPSDKTKSRYVDDSRLEKKADVLVRQLLSLAISQRASDIHIESLSNRLQVRFRIDGVLEGLQQADLQEACDTASREVISRLKILAKLDIAERRRPQDGGFRVRTDRDDEKANVDLRVSVVPSYYGESVVLRLLDRKHAPTSIEQLRLPNPIHARWRQLLQRPSGVLLVTGPTGSGKSTTLYASLMTVYRPQIRVLTAEDPIEYVYEQFSQSEVNAQIGNTFASYLRSFLRHDPEIIMVGEIRDNETAEMAFRAAQTGHLLLSTLHTETAIAAVSRLMDMDVDPNTLASSLTGVMSQRLVRKVCGACSEAYEPPADMVREFFTVRPEGFVFKRGAGCQECNYTGYRGRIGVVELWAPDDEDVLLMNKNAPFEEIRASARRTTLAMSDSILGALQEGSTNLEELVRVVPYQNIADFRQRRMLELKHAISA